MHSLWLAQKMFTSPTRATERRRAALLVLSLCVSLAHGLVPTSIRPSIRRTLEATVPYPSSRKAASTFDDSSPPTSSVDLDDGWDDGALDGNLASTFDQAQDVKLARRARASHERRARRDRLATKRQALYQLEDEERDRQDVLFLLLPVLPGILAFLLWDDISLSLAEFIDVYGAVSRNVDGNLFSNNLLRPTITGVLVPVISIALATLVSTTVNVLRQRQIELRALVNKEACELRLLRRAVLGMFGTRQHAGRRARALALMCGYVDQLNVECNVGAVEALEELQLSGGIGRNELDRLSAMLHGVDGAAASRQGSVGAADDLILSLNGHRSDRVANLLSVFPATHWSVLIALSLTICATFLLVSNQTILQYLNSLQLRVTFAVLVAVCSGTATLCLELADPFRGSFSITEAATQLVDLRACLGEDVKEAYAEAGKFPYATRNFVESYLSGPSDRIVNSDILSDDTGLVIEPSDQVPGDLSGIGGRSDSSADKGGSISSFNSARNSRAANDSVGGRWSSSPSSYGLVSTLYFHLLTGPLGSKVRALGDVVAWIIAFVARRTRSLSRRLVTLSSAVRRMGFRRRKSGQERR